LEQVQFTYFLEVIMNNIPEVKLGLIAVSRDCFPITLSQTRRGALADACSKKGISIYEAKTTVENEKDMLASVEEVKQQGCNALVVFLGNFGPETPETLIAQKFFGPVMFAAAAEDTGKDLINGRGDAYCGMLNCSYNLGLRKIKAIIPEYPVGTPEDIAVMIGDFIPVARAILGIQCLKIITFGPRPQDFFACNAPIKGLYDIGVEIEENSELDLLVSFRAHKDDKRIDGVARDMAAELGAGNNFPDFLPRLAQFELTLLDWAEAHRGARQYVAFADKCWPAFPQEFGFVPCYVNSRLASRGMPVSCEVDIYGALSEYIGACVSQDAVTLLDINNSVPRDLWEAEIKGKYPYSLQDVFMGFHCGNTPICKLRKEKNTALKFQLIQNRTLENGGTPDFTRGTLEGDMEAGKITFFRLHGSPDGTLQSYIAQGEILNVATKSFGGIGVFAIPEMGRFYRHVLIAKHYPHHGGVAFGHHGKSLFSLFDYLGVGDIAFNQPKGMLYRTENPFA
jgi:L-fucose isomerase-like protein